MHLPTATIAYSWISILRNRNSNGNQTGTAGGTYTAPAGVVINAATGEINLGDKYTWNLYYYLFIH